MKTFCEHLNEEVKIGALASGGIDIARDAVRDEINGILAGIAARPCVTPYNSLYKVRKALSYFHIHLPKKVYLEGKHGVEVWEVKQFGEKMGFTDEGEWIKDVPAKYHLFFHYHLIGSMYYLQAKIVDENELEKLVSSAEGMVAEEADAATRQAVAKAKAPKEDPHTALGDCDCSQGDSPSTKDAVKVSMKKIDEEKNDLAGACWKGYTAKGLKKKGGKMVPNCVPVEEGRMPASVIKSKQKLASMTPEEKAKKFAGKSEEQLKSMARRHGYGKDSTEYSKHKKLDEKAPPGAKFERMVKHIKKGYSKDGLSAKEKSIAYATAWKAKKKESND